jgi:hypothetical protein
MGSIISVLEAPLSSFAARRSSRLGHPEKRLEK